MAKRRKEYRCRIELPWFLAMKVLAYMQQIESSLPKDAPRWERTDIEQIIDRCTRGVNKHLRDMREREASR